MDDYRKDYDGSIVLNCRAVINPVNIMNIRPGKVLKLSELARALEFAETCSLSKKVCFDGTVPSFVREKLDSAIGKMGSEIGKAAVKIVPLNPKTQQELRKLSRRGVKNAKRQLYQIVNDSSAIWIKNFSAKDRGLPKSKFKNTINIILKLESISDLENFSIDILKKKKELGRKFISGLVQPSNVDIFTEIRRKLKVSTEDQQVDLLDAMISTFRAHLLSVWAEDRRSAYQPLHSSEWAVTKSDTQSAWSELRKDLPSELKAAAQKETGFIGEHILPPIGLISFMTLKKGAHPLHLVAKAVKMTKSWSGRAFRKLLWDASCLPAEHRNELKDAMEQARAEFHDPSKGIASFGNWKTLISLGSVEGLVFLGSIIASLPIAGIVSTPTALGTGGIGWTIWKVVRKHTGKRGYINFHRSLAEKLPYMQRKAIQEQVERIFRMSLDWNN